MLCIQLGPDTHEHSMRGTFRDSFHHRARHENQLLPIGFTPTGRDIICGRARENFHHDGNRYFRDLIQSSIGPYLAARTKVEKGDAIACIVDEVQQCSLTGGFVKRDAATGRWYRIKESEARDKVGHAIRKAVQRLEDTKPKAAERLRKEYSENPQRKCETSSDDKAASTDEHQANLPTTQPTKVGQTNRSISARDCLPSDQDGSTAKASPRFRQDIHRTQTNQAENKLFNQRTFQNLPIAQALPSNDAASPAKLFSSGSLGQSQLFQRNNLPITTSQLMAHRLMAQQQASAATHLNQLFGLGPADLSHSIQLASAKAADEVWLSAVQQQKAIEQQEVKRLKEFEYACRLALSAPHRDNRLGPLMSAIANPSQAPTNDPRYISLHQLRQATDTEIGATKLASSAIEGAEAASKKKG